MVVTILAILCFIILGLITVAGYRAVIRGTGGATAPQETERCAVCRRSRSKQEMVERQIGDYKLLYFCRECIAGLAADAGAALRE